MNVMTLRKQELDERNLKNKNRQNKSLNHIIANNNKKSKDINKPINKVDYSDFNKFIELIKNNKTKKNKMDLMLRFINQEALEINESIK